LHHAIEIDRTPYWDGGVSANPPLIALVAACPARNVVLVQINPLFAERAPRTPREIRNRVAEIAFARPLAEELERLRHHAQARFSPLRWLNRNRRRLARHRLHHIDGSAELAKLDPGTKVDPKWPLLLDLRRRGWQAADAWLRRDRQQRSTSAAPAVSIMAAVPRRVG
jgi:NTE family protein